MSDTSSDESNSPVRIQEAESSQPSPVPEQRGPPSPDSTVFDEGSRSQYTFPDERVSSSQSILLANQNPCLINLLNENCASRENVISQQQPLESGIMDRPSTSAEALSPDSGRSIEAQQNRMLTNILTNNQAFNNDTTVGGEITSAPEQMTPDCSISNKDEVNPDSTFYGDESYEQPSTSRATSTSSVNENVNISQSKPILRSLLIQKLSPKRNETNKGEQSSSKLISSTTDNKYSDKNLANTSFLAGKLTGNENLKHENRSPSLGTTSSNSENLEDPSSLRVLDSISDLGNAIEEGQRSSDCGKHAEAEPGTSTARPTSSPQPSDSVVEKYPLLSNKITSGPSASTSDARQPRQQGKIVEENPRLAKLMWGDSSSTKKYDETGKLISEYGQRTQRSSSASAVLRRRKHGGLSSSNPLLASMFESGSPASTSAGASASTSRQSGDLSKSNPLLSTLVGDSSANMRSRNERDSASTSTFQRSGSASPSCRQRQYSRLSEENPRLAKMITDDSSVNKNLNNQPEQQSTSRQAEHNSSARQMPIPLQLRQICNKEHADNLTAERSSASELSATPNISIERPTSVSPRPGEVAEQNLIQSNLLPSRDDINDNLTDRGESSSSGQFLTVSPRRKRESETSDSDPTDSPTKKMKTPPKKDDK